MINMAYPFSLKIIFMGNFIQNVITIESKLFYGYNCHLVSLVLNIKVKTSFKLVQVSLRNRFEQIRDSL